MNIVFSSEKHDATQYHWHVVKVRLSYHGEYIEFYKWENMELWQSVKWKWYFEYRAALLKVKYPRGIVEHYWGHDVKPDIKLLEHKENQLTSAKRKITEYENKLAAFKTKWNELFPIEDDPRYQKTVNKIEEKKLMLHLYQSECEELRNKIDQPKN